MTTKLEAQQSLKFSTPDEAESQLRGMQKDLRFTVHEFTVEICVAKLRSESEDFRIPEYQREIVWNDNQKSKFIESVLLGLPVPFIFGVAEEQHEDRIAIIDGRQRLASLDLFLSGGFPLTNLEKLDQLEGYYFADLSPLQQRRFKNRSVRMVVLDGADSSTQFDMFERLNTTGKHPTRAEIRRGAFPGPFTELVIELARDAKFTTLTPMNERSVQQREREELVLRLFCYANRYQEFQHSVKAFLDSYMKSQNEAAASNVSILARHKAEFDSVCSFAQQNLPGGDFARGNRNQTPRVRFEALAVGIALALRIKPDLKHADMKWAESPEFEEFTRTDASNSRPKVVGRIEYARDHIVASAT
jgi:hypothetical protein